MQVVKMWKEIIAKEQRCFVLKLDKSTSIPRTDNNQRNQRSRGMEKGGWGGGRGSYIIRAGNARLIF